MNPREVIELAALIAAPIFAAGGAYYGQRFKFRTIFRALREMSRLAKEHDKRILALEFWRVSK